MARPPVYAYLHGFLSSVASTKGRYLSESLAPFGIVLHQLCLNGAGGASALTPARALGAVDAYLEAAPEGTKLRLIGSSFGGWTAARYAELHPERVERLLLLCPGFALGTRWAAILENGGAADGEAALARWAAEGTWEFTMPSGGEVVRVPWSFVERTRALPQQTRPSCRTTIIHGTHDPTVPIDLSRAFAAVAPQLCKLVEVDDDHALTRPHTLRTIAAEARELFNVAGR